MVATKKHIVYVINSVKRSGPNQVLLNMVRAIDSAKFKVTVVSFLVGDDVAEVKKIKAAGAQYVNFSFGSKKDILSKGPVQLRRVCADLHPDILHSHGILSDIAVLRARVDARLISTVHNDIRQDYSYSFGKYKGMAYLLLHVHYLKKFDNVINCSSTAWSANKSMLPQSQFIRNGIDSDIASGGISKLRKNMGIPANATVYVYAGKLSERKGILNLLSLFANNHTKDEYLLVIGEGEQSEACANFSSENIKLLGFIEDVVPYFSASDVYISASRSEGFSISVIEALEAGLYLLLSDIPSHKEAFEIDPSVYIGESFNNESFPSIKQKLLINKGSREVVQNFRKLNLSAKVMMRQYEEIYDGDLK